MAKFNHVITTSFIRLIRLYRVIFSAWVGMNCRFEPTCSLYAIEALARYGTLKGGRLMLRRLLRCHPWHPGGFDPIP